jgi:hypothetical protein
MVITSYKGQLRASQYLLATEMAKTYDSMLARDINKINLQAIDDSLCRQYTDVHVCFHWKRSKDFTLGRSIVNAGLCRVYVVFLGLAIIQCFWLL